MWYIFEGFLPQDVLAIDPNYSPPENFALTQDPDYPHSWRNKDTGERFNIGDFVYLRNYSHEQHLHQRTTSALGQKSIYRIVNFKKNKCLVVFLRAMNYNSGERELHENDNSILMGDPGELIEKKAVVLSGESFSSLDYCAVASDVFYTSWELESNQGHVSWNEAEEDILQALGYDTRPLLSSPLEEEIDEEEDYGIGACSQDYCF